MIYETLAILSEEVDNYLGGNVVVMENIGAIENPDDQDKMSDKIVLTLVNVKEETTLRNIQNNSSQGSRMYQNYPQLNLNLFIIFTANRSTYVNSIVDLSKIMEFFQGKRVFTQSNTTFNRELAPLDQVGDFKFTVELMSTSYEELNLIWGFLGGKQKPSAMYKLGIVQIDQESPLEESGIIETTSLNAKTK